MYQFIHNQKRGLGVLAILFLLSLLVKLPNLNRPLSKHHEFCTAIALMVMQSWYDDGISAYHYAPSPNYPGVQNAYIQNFAHQAVEDNGHFYYLSHPPLAYYIPFALFELVQSRPNVLGLQIFNLCFHVLAAFGIFLLALLIIPFHQNRRVHWPALAAAGTYLFSPATLWFHGNVYMSDMFVNYIWIWALVSMTFIIVRDQWGWPFLSSFALLLFLTIYTEWLGVFFGAVVGLYSIIRWIQGTKRYGWLALATLLAGCLALGLIALQYSSISGWDALMDYYRHRYANRGSAEIMSSGIAPFWLLIKNYLFNYLPVLILWGLGLVWMWFRNDRFINRKAISLYRISYLFLFFLLPVLLHHIGFVKYNGHDFSVLKSAVFISLITGCLVAAALKFKGDGMQVLGAIMITGILCIGQYYYINRPGKYSWKGERYDQYMRLGTIIREEAQPSEAVFIEGLDKPLEPMVTYYAQRNILPVSEKYTAYQFVRDHPVKQGVVFFLHDGEIFKAERVLTIDED